MSIVVTVVTTIFQLLGYLLEKNSDNKQMMELFYKFIERIQDLYLKSAHLREDAKNRLETIKSKPFQESP